MADESGAPATGANVRKFGRGANECRICGRKQGLVRKYGIYFCRQCFREWAGKMGFKKMS